MPDSATRSSRLDRAIGELLAQAPEIAAAAVVSFDGLPMASALPEAMDEDRVAAMSAALLSLGERAAEGLGRGSLNQVYVEGEHGTVYLVSADDEAVLVAVADKGAKAGMMLYEVRRAAEVVAAVLRTDFVDEAAFAPVPADAVESLDAPTSVEPRVEPASAEPRVEPMRVEPPAEPMPVETHGEPAPAAAQADTFEDEGDDTRPTAEPHTAPAAEPAAERVPEYSPIPSNNSWASYLSGGPTSDSPEPSSPWS